MTVVGSSNGHTEKEVAMCMLKAYDLKRDVLGNPDFEDCIRLHMLQPVMETILTLGENP